MPSQQSLYNEPLLPPVEGQVLRICRWPDVFETADSRRYKTLTWISCPVSFNSTGFQKLLDRFDSWEAAALYGAWQSLCQLAAQSDLRGRLCGEKGEAYNTRRIARMTGLSVEIFEQLIPWALTVQWLEWSEPMAAYDAIDGQENGQTTATQSKQQSDCESVELPNQTLPNQTSPNPMGEREFVFQDWSQVKSALQKCGVTANARAVKAAQAARWTLKHASDVLRVFVASPGAWTPFALKQRFELPAAVAAADGWPDVSADFKAAQRVDALRQRDAAERQRRETQRKKAAADRQTNGAMNFTDALKQRRRQQEEATK